MTKRGFSLIELAIVVIIIGLLIGAIIAAQNLIVLSKLSNARTLTNSAPVNVIEDLEMWLDAVSKRSFAKSQRVDGSTITTWYDINSQLTNKKDATAVNSPSYTEKGINHLPAITFDGSSDYFTLPDLSSLSGGQIFIIVQLDNDPPAGNGQAGLWVMGSDSLSTLFPRATNGRIDDEFGTTARKGLSAHPQLLTNPSIYSAISVDGEWTARLNGSQFYTTATNTAGFSTAPELGRSSGAFYLQGKIGEIILYSRKLSPFEQDQIEEYLSNKWKIDIN